MYVCPICTCSWVNGIKWLYNSKRSIMKTLASIMYTCSYMKSQPCNSNCSKITAISVTYNVIIIKIHFKI